MLNTEDEKNNTHLVIGMFLLNTGVQIVVLYVITFLIEVPGIEEDAIAAMFHLNRVSAELLNNADGSEGGNCTPAENAEAGVQAAEERRINIRHVHARMLESNLRAGVTAKASATFESALMYFKVEFVYLHVAVRSI